MSIDYSIVNQIRLDIEKAIKDRELNPDCTMISNIRELKNVIELILEEDNTTRKAWVEKRNVELEVKKIYYSNEPGNEILFTIVKTLWKAGKCYQSIWIRSYTIAKDIVSYAQSLLKEESQNGRA